MKYALIFVDNGETMSVYTYGYNSIHPERIKNISRFIGLSYKEYLLLEAIPEYVGETC